jgi:pilus assembly protein FimV
VVKQYTENQYDDDLTVGTDDYDDSYYTGSVDLFEFSNDEESPISRLKSLILSIDWEITDDILMQFNEELLDLRDIWANEKINLVYVQALEKISKYIYQKKADSHPSAIKLLLTLYHNLEKIVSSFDLTEEQKKEILLEDVKRFESLKRHISQHTESVDKTRLAERFPGIKIEENDQKKDLLNLKAIVLGIDWEITDEDLNQLRQEVVRLEEKFVDSRPKLILLQGIGTLGAYIKLKKGDAHADAFTILHLFYESLEKIAATPMNLAEEKAILFPAVEKFNSFKKLLGSTITPAAISRADDDTEEDESPSDGVIAPAFADLPEEIIGFQAEEEAKNLGLTTSGSIDDHVESFFMGQNWPGPDAPVARDGAAAARGINTEAALQGVDVEADDEEDFDGGGPLAGGTIAAALSSAIDDRPSFSRQEAVARDEGLQEGLCTLDESAELLPAEEQGRESAVDFDFVDEGQDSAGPDFRTLDRDILLQGVDVETEADDDSGEEALPLMGGELAPALAENDEVSIYDAATLKISPENNIVDDEFAGTLGGFFDEEIESHLMAAPKREDIISEAGVEPEDREEALAFVAEVQREQSPSSSVDAGDLDRVTQGSSADDLPFKESPPARLAEGDSDEDFTGSIDEQLNSFFDFGAEGEKTPAVTSLEDAAGEGVAALSADDLEEEEVIFELVEEIEQSVAPEQDRGTREQKTSGELFEAETSRLPSAWHAEADGKEAERFLHAPPLHPVPDVADDVYGPLRTCVDSLGIELDAKVIQGLWREIEALQQNLMDKPLEKTFLQLLATITRHIDRNRYDSERDAYVLLRSVCAGLTALQEDDVRHNQEMLLAETEKVLKWQEELLLEQIGKNEADLTIGGPILTDQQDEYTDFDELAEGTKTHGDGLKQEISSLRRNLQHEIAELQKKLKR